MKVNTIFITGIGTGVGKTVISSLLVNALEVDYWKPIQAGLEKSDSSLILEQKKGASIIFPESYKLKNATSPHWAANKEKVTISLNKIKKDFLQIKQQQSKNKLLVIEGVGGLLSPINNSQQNIHLIKALNVPVVIVSRNYLGSINHSLMTAQILQQHKCKILGWIFNDVYLNYENDIVRWTKIKKLFSINNLSNLTRLKETLILKKIQKDLTPYI